jgi:hydroxymethylpyrimidine kinase/phosphomethylpyrimidine kinase/thiamine-phosphate diphosphorylase
LATTIDSESTIQKSRPIVWSIAASDSGGGAGIQADLNTIHSLGCHGCTIITAITAQNSVSVDKVHPISAVDLAAQWQALEKDLQPQAIKIGLLPEPSTLRWLARHLEALRTGNKVYCVWDPVLKASTGARFLDAFDRGEIDPLLKQVDLITPNLQEAEMLTKIAIKSYDDVELAAKQLLERGASSVLIKGGHSFNESPMCRDYYIDQKQSFWLSHEKQDQINNHGTGCTLASAIASFVAKDAHSNNNVCDAIVLGNRFIQQGLRLAAPQGQGAGPVWQTALENHPNDFSDLTFSTAHFDSLHSQQPFPVASDLGIYAIVDNLDDLNRLIDQGVNTLQWRVKAESRSQKSPAQLKEAIKICRQRSTPLYINDDWQLALEFNAYGIHLGQEDLHALSHENLKHIQDHGAVHGLKLGISCHNETELAYAHSLKPSYLAFGPVFTPNSKIVDHPSLGLTQLKNWQSGYGQLYPTTCIGGIDLNNMEQVLQTGITSIAAISVFKDKQTSNDFVKCFRDFLDNKTT